MEANPGRTALVRDRDIKFLKEFDWFFEERGIRILKIPYRSPNLNPYAESWVATIKARPFPLLRATRVHAF